MTRSSAFPVRNTLLAAADYVAQPVLLLAITPVLLHHLGTAEFSVYLLVNSVVSASTLLSSGFGDALIRHRLEMEQHSSAGAIDLLARTVITLNALLGTVIGLGIAMAAPWVAAAIRGFSSTEFASCTAALRLGAVLLVLRSLEMAVLACLRSFERYDIAAPVSIAGKCAGLLLALFLALTGYGVTSVIAATASASALAVLAELGILRRQGVISRFRPQFHRATLRHIGSFGTLSWVQALVGVVTQQADRLLVGAMLGAASFSTYSLCAQLAMPVHSFTGASLQALFPRFSRISAEGSQSRFRSTLNSALVVNVACVVLFSAPLLLFAEPVLRHWMGPEIARVGAAPLRWMALAAALLALNVTGYWALMAVGRIRLLVMLNVLGAVAMLAGVVILTPRWGVSGAAIARVLFGPITWIGYVTLWKSAQAEQPLLNTLAEAA